MDLHALLVDLIDRLLTLKDRITDTAAIEDINKVKRILFALLDQVVESNLDHLSTDYQAAMQALAGARTAADEAIRDIEKTSAAIHRAVTAAKAVDKLVQLFCRYLK